MRPKAEAETFFFFFFLDLLPILASRYWLQRKTITDCTDIQSHEKENFKINRCFFLQDIMASIPNHISLILGLGYSHTAMMGTARLF